ncbi:alpha/beta hydrolase [Serinibacter arcticus]|uniref:Putative lipase/esterase n=1 Tax=Serinibacter arcticus TaxID=1655435 RepID=A0A4Z1DZT4_9MICO|nr:alpha/beta hydrolase [Serinibacter arcticus]TGO04459.1 putative lipase/esterase [Serinibacter arcticus]
MTARRAIATTLAAVAGTVVGAAVLAVVAMAVSPWPSALLIRRAFDRGGRETNAALAPLVPDGVHSRLNVPYDPSDPASLLDVHRPGRPDGGAPLPTIVWVHGGGWVSGSKDQVANYLRILAARGFVVVGVDYHLAPRSRYPRPVHQVLTALSHLVTHADDLDLDTSRVVLAGDSAGSQIAAQVAAAISDPAYASALGVDPALRRDHLRAALLHCGAYDLDLDGATSRAGALFMESVLWSYTGRRSAREDPVLDLASVRRHASPAFPPTYLSGGDADPLTPQGLAFAERLREVGVELVADFPSPGAGEPSLDHEFQFDLSSEAGRATLERSVGFLRTHTA